MLVVLSLVLITVYFRESEGGAVHDLQSAGATVLRPFEVAAIRVASPFQDLYDYVAGLVNAKSERDRLRAELESTRRQLIQYQFAAQENRSLRKALRYITGPRFPSRAFRPVSAAIISKPPSQFEQSVVVAAGRADGVADNDPVVDRDGLLVGKVTKVVSHQAQVALLTDEDSAVSAIDLNTRAEGIIKHGRASGSTLFLDQVPRSEHVARLDRIVTAGWHSGKLSSLYPRGIPIGWVSDAGYSSTDLYARVQVTPYADFSSLDSVIVLVARQPQKLR